MRSFTSLYGTPHANKCTLDSLSATENKDTTYYAIRKSRELNILLIRTPRLRQMVAGLYMQRRCLVSLKNAYFRNYLAVPRIPLPECWDTLLWTLGICMLYRHFWTEESLNGMV